MPHCSRQQSPRHARQTTCKMSETSIKGLESQVDELETLLSKSTLDRREKIKQMLDDAKELLDEEREIQKEMVMIRAKHSVDVLFIVDNTMSMKPYQASVATQLGAVLQQLSKMGIKPCVRAGVVAYSDYEKIEPLAPQEPKCLPFTLLDEAGKTLVSDFINKLEVVNGVDFPEDMHGGLTKAATMEWKSESRLVFHIADAPGHGTRLAPPGANLGDRLPEFDSKGAILECLMKTFREDRKVNRYYFIHIRDHKNNYLWTSEVPSQLRVAAKDPAWVVDKEWCDAEFVLQMQEAVVDTISTSIKSAMTGDSAAARKFQLDLTAPEDVDWNPASSKEVFTCAPTISWHHLSGNISNLLALYDGGHHIAFEKNNNTETRLIMAKKPFAKGSLRLVYHGRIYCDGLEGVYQQVVLKESICLDKDANTGACYRSQLEAHTYAKLLGKFFNEQAQTVPSVSSLPPVHYVDAALICIKHDKRRRFMIMEPYLEGSYIKFNDNNGHVAPRTVLDPLYAHFQAFSHWTYEVSHQKLMVVDIQGMDVVTTDDKVMVILTDPAIHSNSKEFFHGTRTNLRNGFKLFLDSHEKEGLHNSLCKAMCTESRTYRNRQKPVKGVKTSGKSTKWKGFSGFPKIAKEQAAAQSTAQGSVAGLQTASTVVRRMTDVKEALKLHDLCKKLLKPLGIACPSNLHEAITMCAARKLANADKMAGEWHAIRLRRNKAVHKWVSIK